MAAHTLSSLSAATAVQHLAAGELIVHATTSLLGIAADPTHPGAVARLDTLKDRVSGRGYVHVVDSTEHAVGWIAGESWQQWLREGLPAPVTWVLPAGVEVPHAVRGPNDTIAIRLDSHPCVAALCSGLGRPIVSTSLNAAGEPPLQSGDRVPEALATHLAGVFTPGTAPVGLPSTVVLVTTTGWQVLRHGAVTEDDLRIALAGTP